MQEIDRVVSGLYRCISFNCGETPQLETLKGLFIPEGLLVNNNGDHPRIFTVEQFIGAVREQVESGNLTEFEEREVWSHTEVFGKIAQRFSTYEARFTSNDPEPFSTGINSIQLIKMGSDWLVTSIIWNDETETMKIPGKYLQNRDHPSGE